MKGRIYAQSHQGLESALSLDDLHLSREYQRPWADDPKKPFFYTWKTSVPKNWQKISPRRPQKLVGVSGVRSTLDFLIETQKYISHITAPKTATARSPRRVATCSPQQSKSRPLTQQPRRRSRRGQLTVKYLGTTAGDVSEWTLRVPLRRFIERKVSISKPVSLASSTGKLVRRKLPFPSTPSSPIRRQTATASQTLLERYRAITSAPGSPRLRQVFTARGNL